MFLLKIFSKIYQHLTEEGGGAEAPWSPQKLPPSLRICRITSRPRKTGLPASVTSPSLPPVIFAGIMAPLHPLPRPTILFEPRYLAEPAITTPRNPVLTLRSPVETSFFNLHRSNKHKIKFKNLDVGKQLSRGECRLDIIGWFE